MDNCIFCKIIKGEIPSSKVWEDDDFLAILDINPNTEGVTLVIPKKHYNSYAFDQSDSFLHKLTTASKKVAKKLEKVLNVERVGMIWEGMGVNHIHAKLYPFHGLGEEFASMAHGDKKVYFDRYPGYMTSQLGEQADFEKLAKLAEKIRKSN